MSQTSIRFAMFGAAVAILGAAIVVDAAPSPTPVPSATSAPTPAPTSPMLVGLWKGYAVSLGKSVFIAWVRPTSASSNDVKTSIDDAFSLITPKLKGTQYSIFIVNVEMVDESGGSRSSERGFIFLREQDGRWESLEGSDIVDKGAFVDSVINAGLPQTAGIDGGVQMDAPLSAPATPTPKPQAS